MRFWCPYWCKPPESSRTLRPLSLSAGNSTGIARVWDLKIQTAAKQALLVWMWTKTGPVGLARRSGSHHGTTWPPQPPNMPLWNSNASPRMMESCASKLENIKKMENLDKSHRNIGGAPQY